jgi:hypothetical protein
MTASLFRTAAGIWQACELCFVVVLAVIHEILKGLLSGLLDFRRAGIVDVPSARDSPKAAVEHFLRPAGGKPKEANLRKRLSLAGGQVVVLGRGRQG